MQGQWLALPLAIALAAAHGCAGGTDQVQPGASGETAHPSDMVLGMIEMHLAQLNRGIDGLDRQIAQLRRMPETTDPAVRELRALDLAGWQLHQQQWTFQRDHLRFALAQLQRAKANPGEKAQIMELWVKQEQAYETAVDGFRQQRLVLERKRLQVEGELVRRHLQ